MAKYLQWVEGENFVHATGIKGVRGDLGKPNQVVVSFAVEPSANSFESPFGSLFLSLPADGDLPFVKMQRDLDVKRVLWPLAELTEETGKGIKVSAAIHKARAILDVADISCVVIMSAREGKVDPATGDRKVFFDCVGFQLGEPIAKRAYETSMVYDDDFDLPE